MTDSKRPKLEDVAREAGVSVTTVSRVLNNRGYLSEKTRTAVAEAMARLNYSPNAFARSLRDSRSMLVGIIFPSVAHPFYGHMAEELERQFSREGYKVLLCNSDDNPDSERSYLSMPMGHQVDGIVTGAHSNAVAKAAQLRAPLVTIDRASAGNHANLRCDDEAAVAAATRGIIERGASSPVHLTSSSREDSPRALGFLRACREAGVKGRVARVARLQWFGESTDNVYAALDSLQADGELDAAVCGNDYLAALALEWARARDLVVPRDLQVIGFDGARATRVLRPELSTVVQPFAQIAQKAVSLIATAHEGEGREDSSVVFDADIHWAGTTRSLP